MLYYKYCRIIYVRGLKLSGFLRKYFKINCDLRAIKFEDSKIVNTCICIRRCVLWLLKYMLLSNLPSKKSAPQRMMMFYVSCIVLHESPVCRTFVNQICHIRMHETKIYVTEEFIMSSVVVPYVWAERWVLSVPGTILI